MSWDKIIDRREMLRLLSRYAPILLGSGYVLDRTILSPTEAFAADRIPVYLAKNGSPLQNVAKVIEMRFGGIENFIGFDDVVVINPNGQWGNQGGSNCACCMALIDLILARPGGFDGEIIFTENTQFRSNGYWTAVGVELERNGPYNFNDMIAYYQGKGYGNVNGIRIWRNQDEPDQWPVVTGPQQGQGWVRPIWYSPTTSLAYQLAYPIIRSPYSNRLIDLKNGVYDNGYSGQPALKFIKVPTLNNHGYGGGQDYAGITSAVKSHLGISDIGYYGNYLNLHSYGVSGANGAFGVGEAIGGWMTCCRKPDIYLTTAEWVGWESRQGQATQARTVGLADDPVTLDYYMAKYVMWPYLPEQQYFDPDFDIGQNMTRQTLEGCHSIGFGTLSEAEIIPYVYDFNEPPRVFPFDIFRRLIRYKKGFIEPEDMIR
jgi:hypothetical protein